MNRSRYRLVLSLWFLAPPAGAAELAVLSNANWDRLAPAGKEADAILGDYAFRSDRVLAVVAAPLATRNANMTVRQVAGAVIDLTLADSPNDQLSAYYPGQRRQRFTAAEIVTPRGKKVTLLLTAPPQPADPQRGLGPQPQVELRYELEDGQPYLTVRTRFQNPFVQPLEIPLEDDLRADNFDAKVKAGVTDCFWVHDRHFEQAYGIVAEGHEIRSRSDVRNSVIQYVPKGGSAAATRLAPGASYELVRRLIVGRHNLAVKGEAARLQSRPLVHYGWHFVDPQFKPAAGVEITLRPPASSGEDAVYATGRSDAWGWTRADLPREHFVFTTRAPGRASRQIELNVVAHDAGATVNSEYEVETAATVQAEIHDEQGRPVPCKAAFHGVNGTTDPNWGPPSARDAVVNLYYSANGRFTMPINPGKYEVLLSHGPAYQTVRVPLTVERSKAASLKATLPRAFATPGWVSADFHSHSSPSGDNTTDQHGRVLNLLAEGIEFAPCTEHNRIDSYMPHLKALGAEALMGTCPGIELTGEPLPLNHHNAFPLVQRPRTQDNGAPLTDADPQVQIRRLAEWDGKAEKLVQQNHPDIGWLFFDKNGDGKPDHGYRAGFPYMHVIEVHPIEDVLSMTPTQVYADSRGRRIAANHTVFNWLQLLNQGYRIPGVVNTDAHYNFHGSGGVRNYVRCDAATPGSIDPLEIVRHARQGHLVMSNGPFLEVRLQGALPGEDLRLPDGKAPLAIRVQCPDWFDVDRVQVLFNGRPDAKYNFTRKTHPELFRKGAVRFEHTVPLSLSTDTHVIVVATGEESALGEAMGPYFGRQRPTAISNPIFVDVDGGGFKANGDTLGAPLPVKGGQ